MEYWWNLETKVDDDDDDDDDDYLNLMEYWSLMTYWNCLDFVHTLIWFQWPCKVAFARGWILSAMICHFLSWRKVPFVGFVSLYVHIYIYIDILHLHISACILIDLDLHRSVYTYLYADSFISSRIFADVLWRVFFWGIGVTAGTVAIVPWAFPRPSDGLLQLEAIQ